MLESEHTSGYAERRRRPDFWRRKRRFPSDTMTRSPTFMSVRPPRRFCVDTFVAALPVAPDESEFVGLIDSFEVAEELGFGLVVDGGWTAH